MISAQIATYMKLLDNGIEINGTISYDEVDKVLYSNRTIVDDGHGNTMKVDVGFVFDGNIQFANLSRTLPSEYLVLVPPPFVPFNSLPFTFTRDSTNISLNVSV